MNRELFGAILSFTWLLLIPLGAILAVFGVERTWLLQDTNRVYWWGAAAAAIWLAGAPFLISLPMPITWRVVGAIAVWGVISGAAIANTALAVINCAGDSSPGEEVTVRIVRDDRFRVHFRVVDGEHAGVVFSCGKSTWNLRDDRPRAFVMHRGRLGLWWGRLTS